MMQSSGEIWPNVIVIQTSIKGKSCREMQKLTVKANNVKHTPWKLSSSGPDPDPVQVHFWSIPDLF